jgi:hypothetical protein
LIFWPLRFTFRGRRDEPVNVGNMVRVGGAVGSGEEGFLLCVLGTAKNSVSAVARKTIEVVPTGRLFWGENMQVGGERWWLKRYAISVWHALALLTFGSHQI